MKKIGVFAYLLLTFAILFITAFNYSYALEYNFQSSNYHGIDILILDNINFEGIYPVDISIIRIDRECEDITLALKSSNGLQNIKDLISDSDSIAGLNGGYFDKSSGKAIGLIVIDGRLYDSIRNLKNTRPVLTYDIFNELKVYDDSSDVLDHSKLHFAITGGPTLIRNGKIFLRLNDEGFSDKLNPLSAIGYNSKYIFLVAVSGRFAGQSLGLNYSRLAKLMKEIGVNDAICLDGGGSTALVLKNQQGNYKYLNSLSDKNLRKISNAISVNIKKQKYIIGISENLLNRLNYTISNFVFEMNHFDNPIIKIIPTRGEPDKSILYDLIISDSVYNNTDYSQKYFIIGGCSSIESNDDFLEFINGSFKIFPYSKYYPVKFIYRLNGKVKDFDEIYLLWHDVFNNGIPAFYRKGNIFYFDGCIANDTFDYKLLINILKCIYKFNS